MVDEREIEAIRERHEDMVKYLASNGNKGPWDFIGQDAHADRATLLSALDAERERVAALEAALAPFANVLDEYEADREPLLDSETLTISTAVHVFRTARSVLESGHE